MFFAIILSFLLLSHYYLGIHLIKPLDLSKNQKILCWSLVFLSCIFEPLILTIGYKYPFPDKIKKILFFIGYAHLGFLAILLFLLIFKDLLFLGIKIIDWFAALKSSDPKLILPDSPEKRLFLKNSINKVIGVSTLALGGVALYEGRKLPNIKRVTVPIKDLPKELEGLTIAQISDLHVGPTIKKDFVEKVVQRVNELDVDFVAVTGDLMDGSISYLKEDVAPLKDFKSKFGTFYCTGNHEYYSGAPKWCDYLEKEIGFNVLINQNQILQRNGKNFMIAGITDYSAGRFLSGHKPDAKKTISTNIKEVPLKILLAHQPRSLYQSRDHHFDLQLSGHTHGGQIFPFNFFIHLVQPVVSGLKYTHGRWVYVNQGTGYWGPPMRLAVPSEISYLTLTKA